MVKERMDLLELLRKGGMDGDVDFLREALRVLVEGIMDAEVSSRIGAEYGEHGCAIDGTGVARPASAPRPTDGPPAYCRVAVKLGQELDLIPRDGFLGRPLAVDNLWLDALTQKVREDQDRQRRSVATAVNGEGREIIGMRGYQRRHHRRLPTLAVRQGPWSWWRHAHQGLGAIAAVIAAPTS